MVTLPYTLTDCCLLQHLNGLSDPRVISHGDAGWKVCLPMYYLLKVKVTRSYLTLCDPIDYTVHEILQASILDWVAVPFFQGYSQPRDQTQSHTSQADSLPAELPVYYLLESGNSSLQQRSLRRSLASWPLMPKTVNIIFNTYIS